MKNIKGFITKNLMKGIGSLALILGALVIFPNSLLGSYQPKCPDEFLK